MEKFARNAGNTRKQIVAVFCFNLLMVAFEIHGDAGLEAGIVNCI